MAWTIHSVNARNQLDPALEPILGAIECARHRIETVVPPTTLDIVVQAWPGRVIERFGFVGYAPTADMIQLTIDPGNPNLAAHLGEPFERMVAHEVHHTLRCAGPGYGTTLGEALVSEGLAGRFAQQVYLSEPEHYERALEPDRLRELASLADGLWETTDYNHSRWFFGASDLPVHAGYTLGFVLTGAYLDAHAEATAASLVHKKAAAFRPFLEVIAQLDETV